MKYLSEHQIDEFRLIHIVSLREWQARVGGIVDWLAGRLAGTAQDDRETLSAMLVSADASDRESAILPMSVAAIDHLLPRIAARRAELIEAERRRIAAEDAARSAKEAEARRVAQQAEDAACAALAAQQDRVAAWRERQATATA